MKGAFGLDCSILPRGLEFLPKAAESLEGLAELRSDMLTFGMPISEVVV